MVRHLCGIWSITSVELLVLASVSSLCSTSGGVLLELNMWSATVSQHLLTSNGYKSWSGRLSRVERLSEKWILTVAPRATPSAPLIRFSTLANFQKPLGRLSSWTSTTSPTAIGPQLLSFGGCFAWRCDSQSSKRYSFFHHRRKCSRTLFRWTIHLVMSVNLVLISSLSSLL